MLYTTRNPREALAFINSLPFEDHEKEEIVSFFPVMDKFMEEMKDNKQVNSKGGERWFQSRVTSKIQAASAQINSMLEGLDPESMQRAQLVASQNAVATAVLELAEECNASAETINQLSEYCSMMNALVRKYTIAP